MKNVTKADPKKTNLKSLVYNRWAIMKMTGVFKLRPEE